MNKKYFKDFALLGAVIIICAVAARLLAGGETLEQYASNNPDTAGGTASATVESSVSGTATTSNSGSSEDASSSVSSNKDANDLAAVSTERVTYVDGFYYEPISNDVFKRISGVSYPVDCTISLDDLRYVSLLYVDFDGNTQSGEMICNKAIAQDILEIFSELYDNRYQIESIKLIDEFDGDDTASMLANNTSCFNYRVVEGTTRLSNHAKGLAIDLNPFYNPYITYNKDGSTNISPEGSEAYADRNASFPYKIDENDLAYKLFKEHGFTWGGNWNSVKDYQHFEKKIG
ncbi:D-alanyl-D-alanine carboxypeptidase [Butyrivibrio sp. INlla18]|uniref:M15 family metallopeptidase n=1 Tax=Butyrivibrio sp. INlla18 TaxID=1520806 RepID=UPI000889649B|nr:M15 family metallopeptidase [Butyrivibrio sp. INlla18]SDA46188.1 D-alanyl-D-alanine carboxypeptidase [Butyrivibrio sp. INlla18]